MYAENMYGCIWTQVAALLTTRPRQVALQLSEMEDQIAADTKDMDEEKANKAASEESKAIAVGDLAETTKSLANSDKVLETTGTTQINCINNHLYDFVQWSILKQVVAGGFYNMWMANVFERMGGKCF